MATTNARVQFVLVPAGKTKPASVDQNTIYFLEDAKEIHVGSLVIACPTDVSDFMTQTEIEQAIEDAATSVTVTGTGDTVVDASYDASTKTLTLTKGNAAAYTLVKKATPNTGASASYQLQKDGTATGVDVDIPEAVAVPTYTLKKQATAEDGYSATYQLFKDNVAEGDKINIPKDMVVSSGEVKEVTAADTPYSGAVVGDKYIELTIANASSDKIYIPVKDLVDVYTGGTGITVSDANVINHASQGADASTDLGTDSATEIHVSGQIEYDTLGHVISVADKNIYSGVKTVADDEIEAALDDLSLSDVGGNNKYIKLVSQADGKVNATAGDVDTTAASNSANLVTSGAAYQAAQDAIATWTVVS